ncbi:MAG: class I SAM-dependent methyltransferase [Actinomycetota bacterium]
MSTAMQRLRRLMVGRQPDGADGDPALRAVPMTAQLAGYVERTWVQEPSPAAGLRAATERERASDMRSGSDQGRVLHWLVGTLGARQTIEVGVFTGYSALWTALALPDDGLLVACDVSERWTSVGAPFWAEAGVDHKIDLRIAPATETLDALLADGQADSFDLAFIDADKSGYDDYYERCLQLVRPGGVVAVDNVLWDGAVADPEQNDADTAAIKALNAKIGDDDRVDVCLIPTGDGLTLARRLG